MLNKINKTMRKIFLITGSILFLFNLTKTRKNVKALEEENFEIQEFDDIW